jgi:rod shape determining protein RodA
MVDVAPSRTLSLGGRTAAIRHLDLVTVGAVVALVVMGLVSVLTATVDSVDGNPLLEPSTLFNRQLVFCVLAGLVLLAAILFDYRYVKVYAGVMYLANLALLLFVLTPIGQTVKGSQRWISLGILNLQPSELAKPVLLAALAAYIAERRGYLEIRDVVRCIGLTAPYALLVFIQPDFGTVLVLGSILLVMLIIGGADWRHLLVLIAMAAFGAVAMFQLGVVRDYQRTRLAAFLDPEQDRFSEGYNYLLTRQAVGNGGLVGHGLFSNDRSLTNLDFVREQHTDFVFTVVAEQMGFLGGFTMVLLYGIIFIRGLRGAGMARDRFGGLLATGVVGYMAFQVFVNIGMTVGLVPITGIPLPFVSYGGSSLLSSALAVGLVLSVRMRRFSRPLP